MIGIAASILRSEEKQLLSSLERRGVPNVRIDPRTYAADLCGEVAPPFRGVLNREVAHTRGLYISRFLEGGGVDVLNDAQTSEVCSDKARSTLAFRRERVPTPRTVVALGAAAAREAALELGLPVVAKPVIGSWGRLTSLLRDEDGLVAMIEHREAMPPHQRVFYLQEFIPPPRRDFRVIVMGKRILGAAVMASGTWRRNAHQGAEWKAFEPTDDLANVVLRAQQAVGAVMGGIDVVQAEDGRLLVLEVNHVFGFHAFEEAHGWHGLVAEAMVDLAIERWT